MVLGCSTAQVLRKYCASTPPVRREHNVDTAFVQHGYGAESKFSVLSSSAVVRAAVREPQPEISASTRDFGSRGGHERAIG